MYLRHDFFTGEVYFVDSNGENIPFRVESVDFNPDMIGPEITGYLLERPGVVGHKKNDSLIKKVIFNDPATIVIWSDNTKTVVKCQPGDTYSEELGLAMCISKKFLGNKGNFNEEFKKWIPDEVPESIEDTEDVSLEEMIEVLNNACDNTICKNCIFTDITCDIDELDEAEIKRQYEMLKKNGGLK